MAWNSIACGEESRNPNSMDTVESLITKLQSVDEGQRIDAVNSLGLIGQAASAALDKLRDILTSDAIVAKRAAAGAIWEIGAREADLHSLIEALNVDDEKVQFYAARAVVGLKTVAAPAVPALIRAMSNGTNAVPDAASFALCAVGPLAVPALIQSLSTNSDQLRWWVVTTLGKMGSQARSALPALVDAKDKSDGLFQGVISHAIERIGCPS